MVISAGRLKARIATENIFSPTGQRNCFFGLSSVKDLNFDLRMFTQPLIGKLLLEKQRQGNDSLMQYLSTV